MRSVGRVFGCSGVPVHPDTEIAPTGSDTDQRHIIHFMGACTFGHQLLDANTSNPEDVQCTCTLDYRLYLVDLP